MINWNSDRLYNSNAAYLHDISKLNRATSLLSDIASQLTDVDAYMPLQLAERIEGLYSVSQELVNALEAYDALFLYRGEVPPLSAACDCRSQMYAILEKRQNALTEIAIYCLKHKHEALKELRCFLRMFRCPESETLFSEYQELHSKLQECVPSDAKIEDSLAQCLFSVKACTYREVARAGFRSPLEAGLFGTGLCERDIDTVFAKIAQVIMSLHQEITTCLCMDSGTPKAVFSKADVENLIYSALSPVSPRIEGLLDRAFTENWIDWNPEPGKLAGARHFRINRLRESRILLNFTGCLDDVFALTHELGHAWQANCMMTDSDVPSADYGSGIKELGAYVFEHLLYSYLKQGASGDLKTELQMRTVRNDLKLLCEVPVRYRLEKLLYDVVSAGHVLYAESITSAVEKLIASFGVSGLPGVNVSNARIWMITPGLFVADDCFYNYEYTFCFLEALTLCHHMETGDSAEVKRFERLLGASANMNIMDVHRLYQANECGLFSNEISMAEQNLRQAIKGFFKIQKQPY